MKEFLWVDLETTGLDEKNGLILEVSAVVTDEKFSTVEEFSTVVGYQRPLLMSTLNKWSTEQHTKSGLIEEVVTSSITEDQVCTDLAAMIKRHWYTNLGENKPILCGNSIHFDRKWISHCMPYVDSLLHYRMIDVSGIYEAYRGFAGLELEKTEGKHRGPSDIYDSISLCKKAMIPLLEWTTMAKVHRL